MRVLVVDDERRMAELLRRELTADGMTSIADTLTKAIADHGVLAVFLLMAADALLPVGGELVMAAAGAIATGT